MTKPYIVTFKDDATDLQVQAVKDQVTGAGGLITTEYSLIKGFAAELPEDQLTALEAHEHVNSIEADGEVKTQ